MKLLNRLSTTLLATFIMSSASAGVITYDSYVYDDATNYVVGGGLEWLRWDVTLGQSINDAVAAYSGDGYRVANNVEMAALFDDFAFGSPGFWDTDEDTGQAVELSSADNAAIFNSMFGITYVGGSHYASAWYGDDADGDSLINFASVRSAYLPSPDIYSALLQGDLAYTASASTPQNGVVLVRTHVASSVPEPSMLLLFLSGIFGFYLRSKPRKA